MNPFDHQDQRNSRHDDERTRDRCIRLLIAYQGEGWMREFLLQPQPDLEYRTGEELLENHPDELLCHLKAYKPNPHADE